MPPTDDELRQMMRAISQANGRPLSDARIAADLTTYRSYLEAIERLSRVELPRQSEPLPRLVLPGRGER